MNKISIIILTKNAGDNFVHLLKMLYNQSYNNFEIIIIDSGSADSTIKIAKKFGCRIYNIDPEEFHHSKTRNYGASLAKGDILLFITQDALPTHSHSIYNLVRHFDSENIAGSYGRQIAYPSSQPTEQFFYSYYYPNKYKILKYSELINNIKDYYFHNSFISDVFSAIKKNLLLDIPFDENLFMAEDKKWSIDILNKGYNLIYDPSATVYHSHDYSLKNILKRRFDDGMSMKRVMDSNSVSYSEGAKYFVNHFIFISKKYFLRLPYSLMYTFLGYLGFFLGANYKYLPVSIINRISNYKH